MISAISVPVSDSVSDSTSRSDAGLAFGLTPTEVERYRRQMMLPGLGEAGQQKLKKYNGISDRCRWARWHRSSLFGSSGCRQTHLGSRG